MNPRFSICIVTPNYLSSTPRVVKEADALFAAGFDVRVVFSQGNLEVNREYDALLLKEKRWKWHAVAWSPFKKGEKWLYHKSRLRAQLAGHLSPLWPSGRIVEHSAGRVYRELAVTAAAQKADLFIGHYPAGLSAAAHAADYWDALLAYDVEDLHFAEAPATAAGNRYTRQVEIIEGRYLKRCVYVSAVSKPVATEMAKRYDIPEPLVLHNVFPASDLALVDGEHKDRTNRSAVSLYWYSQTIGEGRGIEDAIRASGMLRDKAEIHLRGTISDHFRNSLITLARQHGVEQRLFFHRPVPPHELLSRAQEHDVGLALEQPITLSRELAVTNKLFFYLLAGLAVASTAVRGQQTIMDAIPNVGFTYNAGDYHGLADRLNELISTPGRLDEAKQAALQAGVSEWNWEVQSRELVNLISRVSDRSYPGLTLGRLLRTI